MITFGLSLGTLAIAFMLSACGGSRLDPDPIKAAQDCMSCGYKFPAKEKPDAIHHAR